MNTDCLIAIVAGICLLSTATVAALADIIAKWFDAEDVSAAQFLALLSLGGALLAVCLAAYYMPPLARLAEHG